MHRIVWSDEGTDHLAGIKHYVAQFDLAAAADLADRLTRLADSLGAFPDRGRPASGGIREMVTLRPYILQYTGRPGVVTILGIRHSAQSRAAT